jgi:hypothetical protein
MKFAPAEASGITRLYHDMTPAASESTIYLWIALFATALSLPFCAIPLFWLVIPQPGCHSAAWRVIPQRSGGICICFC